MGNKQNLIFQHNVEKIIHGTDFLQRYIKNAINRRRSEGTLP